jgi:phosphoglucosamine mutase
MKPRLFGTDGVRGPAGVGKLAPPALARLGLAVARVLRARQPAARPRCLLGRDTRVSGQAVAAAITSGLLTGGVEVHDGGVLPTPAVALLTRRRRFDLGLVVSASHNAWCDNGLKLLGATGSKLEDEEEAAVEAAYRAKDLESGTEPEAVAEAHAWPDARASYESTLVREFRGVRLRKLHVVVDAANGAQSGIAARVLRRLGARVTALHDRPDGRNINRRCGALHPGDLRRTVKRLGADAGVAFDGDADRLQMVDEKGRLLDGDVVLAALAPRLLAARRLRHRTVVGTVMTNAGLEADRRERDIRLVRTAVGDRNIVSEMAARGYGLGGEPSGHLIVPRRGLLTGDALYAAVACLRILTDEGLRASELAGTFRAWPLELVSLPVRKRIPLRDLPRTWGAINEGRERLGDGGRLVVRYSGTEPKVRVMVEARKRALVRQVLGDLVAALEAEVGAG